MNLPTFSPGDDPGPDFARLVRNSGLSAPVPSGDATLAVPHGTTCLAVRFADGVIMAGDRRATSGNLISHRNIEKVFPGDRYSGVAIAGAAGPAVQMVRLFQLQLEHYEKVEGDHLSLEGKANQLSQMVAQHLPMAMQGLAVVPIFAGYDLKRGEGDNPTVGLIRCAERDEVVARYSVLHESQQLFASKYMLHLPSEEELQAELARERMQVEAQLALRDEQGAVDDADTGRTNK